MDDFAERFADDDSLEEMQSPPVERRAVGLARALQAGALSAVTLPAPRDLAGYKQVLAAHAALASGRHSAAVALREVLRELYPAALRAYPDPAEPVSLAVLDALPEPGMLGGTIARGREVSVAADAIAAHLAADGVADAEEINEAVTALRVAISETPRRAAVNRALTSAVAETVRQAVASVRACDAGCEALVSALSARVSTPAPAPGRRAAARRGESVGELTGLVGTGAGLRSVRPTPATAEPAPVTGRRSRPEPAPGSAPLASPRPLGPPPVAPAPVTPPPVAPAPIAPAAVAGPPVSAPPGRAEPTPSRIDGPANRPVSSPPPPPPGITPIAPAQRGTVPPAEAGEPFRPTLTTAAINHARAERQRTVIPPRPKTNGERQSHVQRPVEEPPTGGFSATDLSIPVPAPRPGQEPTAPPGSRANWPWSTTRRTRPTARRTTRSPTRTAATASTPRPIRAGPTVGSRRPGWPTTCPRSRPCCGWSSRRRWRTGHCGKGSTRPPATPAWRRRRCGWSTGSRPPATTAPRPASSGPPSTGRRPRSNTGRLGRAPAAAGGRRGRR